jgi:chromosome segregation ATPase
VQYDQLQEGVSFLRDPSTLTAYDAEAVRLSLTLHPRYPEELEQALGAARSESTTAQCALAAGRSEIAAMHLEIKGASAHIEQVTAQLVRAQDALRARDVAWKQITDAMQREIEAASAHIEQVTGQLLQTREQLRVSETRHREIETASTHLADAMHREIERASTHIEHVTAQLVQTREALQVRDMEIAARSVHIATLVEALDQRAADIERWRSVAEGLTRQRDAFERSLSWRWTAPVRAIVHMFKRS